MRKYYPDYDRDTARDREWIEEQRDNRNAAMYGSQKAVSGSNLVRYARKSDMDYPTRADMMCVESKNKPNRRNVPPKLWASYLRWVDTNK